MVILKKYIKSIPEYISPRAITIKKQCFHHCFFKEHITSSINRYNNSNKAFNLIELAIVITIISILIVAVVVGNQVIQQAKLRSVINDIKQYKMSTTMFNDAYGELPGDLSNAQSFWPSCSNQTSPVNNNCNGNGNKKIDMFYEGMRMWEHLSLANLIGESYIGIDLIANGSQFNIGINSPKIAVRNGCYSGNSLENDTNWYNITSSIAFILGKPTTNSYCKNSVFIPQEAFYIDQKIDDGKAETGFFVASEGDDVKDTNPNDCSNGDYNFSIGTPTCKALFNASF
jgi:prepilin-type N-terminal cleavage/methylation domain-containing protein